MTKSLILSLLTFILCASAPLRETQSASSGEPAAVITLKEINNRTWLIDSSGNPFWAHGLTNHYRDQITPKS